MSDAIREAFEQWAQDKSLIFDIREEMMYTAGYINVKEMAWEAFCKGWQAALQSGEAVVPEGYVLLPIHAFGEWFTEGKEGEE